MRISIRYGSHLPVLTKIVEATSGPILELGIGLYSTPYLHWACFPTKRQLVSYDSAENWIRYFKNCRSEFHEVNLITDWDNLRVDRFWDIVFIDHAPDFRRGVEAGRLANNANFIILHDTEPERDSLYGYSKIYSLFRYRIDYTLVKPHTSILSNFVDLRKIKEELL